MCRLLRNHVDLGVVKAEVINKLQAHECCEGRTIVNPRIFLGNLMGLIRVH